MTTVSIKQDADSADLAIDATLGGETKQLVPGHKVKFDVEDGGRFLYLDMISESTGYINFTLNFTNAQRFNGDRFFDDEGFDGYYNKIKIYVPGVS